MRGFLLNPSSFPARPIQKSAITGKKLPDCRNLPLTPVSCRYAVSSSGQALALSRRRTLHNPTFKQGHSLSRGERAGVRGFLLAPSSLPASPIRKSAITGKKLPDCGNLPLTLTLSRRERGLSRTGKSYAKVSLGRKRPDTTSAPSLCMRRERLRHGSLCRALQVALSLMPKC